MPHLRLVRSQAQRDMDCLHLVTTLCLVSRICAPLGKFYI